MKADMWQGSADVHINNVQSQALCKSLGGKRGLRTCWSVEWFRAFFSSHADKLPPLALRHVWFKQLTRFAQDGHQLQQYTVD